MISPSFEPNRKMEPFHPSNQTQNGAVPFLKLGTDPFHPTSLSNQTLPTCHLLDNIYEWQRAHYPRVEPAQTRAHVLIPRSVPVPSWVCGNTHARRPQAHPLDCHKLHERKIGEVSIWVCFERAEMSPC
jgi:hypothetical protein